MLNKKQLSLLCISASLFAASGSVFAGSNTAALNVSATVASSCTISTLPVSFGTYNPTNPADTTTSGSVTLTCVKNSDPIVSLDFGQNATAGTRAMKDTVGGVELLSYQLYQPSSVVPNTACTFNETVAWGNAGAEQFDPPAATNIAPQTYNICGKIPAGQDVAAGSYQDTVTAQVDF